MFKANNRKNLKNFTTTIVLSSFWVNYFFGFSETVFAVNSYIDNVHWDINCTLLEPFTESQIYWCYHFRIEKSTMFKCPHNLCNPHGQRNLRKTCENVGRLTATLLLLVLFPYLTMTYKTCRQQCKIIAIINWHFIYNLDANNTFCTSI